jgi:hypothetical protein
MDELLGYGSDSSGSECSNRGKNNDGTSKQTTKATSHLDGLLVGYGDCDSSEEENEAGTSDHNESSISSNKGLERALPSDQALDSGSHVAKKAKISKMSGYNEHDVDGEANIATVDKSILRTPRLRLPTDDPYDSLILFRKDYLLTKSRKTHCIGTQEDQVHEKQLLNTLDQLQNNGASSFARTLKSQKEFGNPHLFSEIISHFEIDPLESNIRLQQGNTIEGGTEGGEEKNIMFERFEYVDRLLQKEEEIRNRTLL